MDVKRFRFSFIILALDSLRSVTSGLRRPSPLPCAVGHAATFVVNAALVASQWQFRAWTVTLHPPINAEYEAGQHRRSKGGAKGPCPPKFLENIVILYFGVFLNKIV